MMTNRVQQVLRQIESLNADERQSLVEYLKEQERQDAAGASASASEESLPEPDLRRLREYEWLRQHRDEYAGQYVALSGDRLVAHAATLQEAQRLAREAGAYRPLYVRIEATDEPPFGGW